MACHHVELNPQRKLFVSVLAVALVALVVDRVIIGGGGGPASAHAAGEAPPGASSASGASQEKPAQEAPIAVPSLAERLRDLEKARRVPARPDEHTVQPGFSDAFLADGTWLPRQAEAAPAGPVATKPEAPGEPESHGLTISAVLNHLAVINGKPFKLNEQMELEVAGGRKVMVTLLEVDGKAREVRVLADGRELVLAIASKDKP